MTDLRAVSATTGEPIGDPLLLNRLERKRALTRPEIDEWLADHEMPIRHETANIVHEIAAQLREELRGLEIAQGSPEERMEWIAGALAKSEAPMVKVAGKLVELALIVMRSP